MVLRLIDKGINLIKSFEGIPDGNPKTVNLDPYICPAGYWTIGWGHVVRVNGKMLKGAENKALAYAQYPNGITIAQAEELLKQDIVTFIDAIKKMLKVELNDNQDNALISFAFNLGPGNLAKSTLLKKVNANPNDPTIRNEFMKWVSKGTAFEKGLTRRRAAEADLYFS